MPEDVYTYIWKMEVREESWQQQNTHQYCSNYDTLKNIKQNQPLFYLLLKDVHVILNRKANYQTAPTV